MACLLLGLLALGMVPDVRPGRDEDGPIAVEDAAEADGPGGAAAGAMPGSGDGVARAPSPRADASSWAPRERLRLRMDKRRTVGVLLGLGGRVDSVRVGDPADAASQTCRDRTVGVVGALHLRFLGYDEVESRQGRRLVWFGSPDLDLGFLFGGNLGKGGLFGGNLQAGLSGGLGSPGPVGVYLKGSLALYGQLAGKTPGAFGMFPLGLGAGLRVASGRALSLLVGPRVDGVLGVQRVLGPPPKDGTYGRLVTQVAVGGDLALHASVGRRDAYLGVTGSVDSTALGQATGGQRLQGRGTLDVSMRLNKGDLRLMLALSYRGYRVTAPPGSRQFDPLGETLGHHYFLFNVGLGG